MTKKIFKILSQPRHFLSAQDLTPEQKVKLYSIMQSYGAKQGFTYDRVFHEGFDEWELYGIDNIKRDFLKENETELGDYDRILALAATEKGKFYAILGNSQGLKKKLKEKLLPMGMVSATCYKRFVEDNWKTWEKVGFLYILEEFINQESSTLEEE